MRLISFLIILLTLILNSCSKSTNEDFQETIVDNNTGWTVDLKDIVGDLSPFPLAQNPIMSSIAAVEGLNDESSVAIISFNGNVNIYPLNFVHPFETINDTLNNKIFTLSYCPITQSTMAIDRKNLDSKLTLRASGVLYKENLVMYDNISNSFWSQMLLKKIKGASQNEILSLIPMIETSWKTAKTYFPNAKVFTNKSITSSKSKNSLKSSGNIGNDEKVFGFIENINSKNSSVFIYQYEQLNNGINVISVGNINKKIVIGSTELNFITAFLNENNNSFTAIQNEFPIVMIDNFGNKWNVFGEAESGPNKGNVLKSVNGFVASWWAWESFYDDFVFI